jgi:preprotein translocase subunit YajC
MESPFDSSFILMCFVVFAYLYMMIINRRSQKSEEDVERHYAGYKQE